MSTVGWFRAAALVEAATYLVLLAASASRHVLGARAAPVFVCGLAHGLVFLAYLALAVAVRPRLGWTPTTTATVIVAAVVPLGALWVERRLSAEVAQPQAVRHHEHA
ncbi:MAG TPA: DUF3817 domain-containing protein [Acidimicrobiales bacterium]|nr:DUF3817 domain-containing protein [Acidimicrobiales bacterium]